VKLLRTTMGYTVIPHFRKASKGPAIPWEFADYANVFLEEEAAILPPLKGLQHAIKLDGSKPPYRPIYSLSETELAVLRKYIKDSGVKGWIRKSKSPASAPILFAPKKDRSLRLCVDY
jgi:hypothetical protein